MRVVGKGSWKYREVGKPTAGLREVGKNFSKLNFPTTYTTAFFNVTR